MKLADYLKKHKISQTKLAKGIEMSKTSLCMKLSGCRSFSTEDIRNIRDFLHLNNDEVVEFFID